MMKDFMKKTILITISVLIFLALFFVIFKFYEHSVSLNKSINLAIEYMENNTLDNGRFVYRTNVYPWISFFGKGKKYNCTRHAGVLYAMYLCERYLKNYSLKEKRYLASEYLIKNYIKEISPDMYAVISNPKEENLQVSEAKLGSTGLALCSLSNLYPEGKIDLKILQGLGDFIIYMQKSDGSFYSKYIVPEKLKSDKFVSLYYPGEAALGLLFLNEVDPDKKWTTAAQKALLYLANFRKDPRYKGNFDHWALIATKKLFETPNNGLNDDEKQLLQTSVENMTYAVLDKQVTDKNSPYRGSFVDNIQLGSIATIMEGLTAAYYVTNDRKLKAEIKKALKLGTGFLSRYQVKEGTLKGGIPANAYWNSPDRIIAKIIRIDNVQHALSAWILYKQIGWFK